MTPEIPCHECGTPVLQAMFQNTAGRCMPCFRKAARSAGIEPGMIVPTPFVLEKIRVRNRHLAEFHPVLSGILKKELDSGNSISEISEGWPRPETIFIMVSKPFLCAHTPLPPGTTYRELTDRHYWQAEYYDEAGGHLLTCPFPPL